MFETLSKIHARSYNNKKEISLSHKAACFHCLKRFDATEIVSFKNDNTAICPRCNKDTVIGDRAIKGKFVVQTVLDKALFLELNETFDTNAELMA